MDKLDKIIQEKFKNRTLEPSVSAWERLSHQLDKEEAIQPKKNWFLYVGYAASIALLISVFFMMNKKDANNKIINKEIMVETTIDTTNFKQPLFKETSADKVIVLAENPKKEIEKPVSTTKNRKKQLFNRQQVIRERKNVIARNETFLTGNTNSGLNKENKNTIVIARKNDEAISITHNTNGIAQNETSDVSLKRIKSTQLSVRAESRTGKIKINPDDLLFEVTHSSSEIAAYYAKYNVHRSDVLQRIKKQLKKSNLKIDPATILAEVEKTIDDDFFQNNFLKKLRLKVTDIAVAFADRNN